MTWNNYSKKRKYSNQKATSNNLTELAGRRFDSRLERDRAEQLVFLQRDGQISNLEFQKTIYLTRSRIGYRPDFVYDEDFRGGSRLVYEDSKGFETERWKIIKKLWPEYGPGLLRITMKGHGGKIRTVKEIFGKG